MVNKNIIENEFKWKWKIYRFFSSGAEKNVKKAF